LHTLTVRALSHITLLHRQWLEKGHVEGVSFHCPEEYVTRVSWSTGTETTPVFRLARETTQPASCLIGTGSEVVRTWSFTAHFQLVLTIKMLYLRCLMGIIFIFIICILLRKPEAHVAIQ
jgi:hypothetical protein